MLDIIYDQNYQRLAQNKSIGYMTFWTNILEKLQLKTSKLTFKEKHSAGVTHTNSCVSYRTTFPFESAQWYVLNSKWLLVSSIFN